MKTELKTALVMGIILVAAIGGASAYFSSLDSIQKVPNKPNESIQTQTADSASKMPAIDKSMFKKAPELAGIAGYINSSPEELKDAMKDKVVLYDIWTYSCINCQEHFHTLLHGMTSTRTRDCS